MSKQALDGKVIKAFAMDPFTLVVVGVDTEDTPENQATVAHIHYDRRILLPINDEMVANFLDIGVKEPVIVKKFIFKSGSKVFGNVLIEDTAFGVVLDGRQRILHARSATEKLREEAGREAFVSVPAMLESGSDDVSSLVTSFSLNHFRKEETPYDKAIKAKQLWDITKDESLVCRRLQWGPQRFREMMALLSHGAPELKEAVQLGADNGGIGASAAVRLAQNLTKDEQVEELHHAVETGNTSISAVEKRIREKKRGQAGQAGKSERTIRNATFGEEFKKPEKDKLPEPGRRQMIALLNELERMIEEDNRADETQMDAIAWAFRWLVRGARPPACVVDAIAHIMKRAQRETEATTTNPDRQKKGTGKGKKATVKVVTVGAKGLTTKAKGKGKKA